MDSIWPASPPDDPWQPSALLQLPRGELIVAERSQNRLFLIAGPGTPVKRLSPPGRWVVEWTDLALAPGLSFLILDGPGRIIHQYDATGNYLGIAVDLEIRGENLELGLLEPAGLAASSAGQSVVTDRLGDRLLVFNASWDLISVWGETGAEPGQWRRPEAVAAMEGEFLVSDVGNRRLVLLDDLGGVLAEAPLEETILDVSTAGNEWVALTGRELIFFDRDLLPVRRMVLPADCGEDALPSETLYGTSKRLFVSDGCTGRVLSFTLGTSK